MNLDGRLIPSASAVVDISNGAFRYGIGLFETMLFQDGSILLEAHHMDRLFSGLAHVGLSTDLTPSLLSSNIRELAGKNDCTALARIRVQVSATGKGIYARDQTGTSCLIEALPLDIADTRLNISGLSCGIASGVEKSADDLANLKSTGTLLYGIAARQAAAANLDDMLILNTKRHIAESTISNVFWIKNGTVFTPPLSEGCIDGVMRKYILSNINVIQKPLTLDELAGADELFLTNAIKKIKWVASVNQSQHTNRIIIDIYNSVFV